MINDHSGSWHQVLASYKVLEPDGADTWNPLNEEFELGYRLSLFYTLAQALGFSHIAIESLKILDMGCGNGRSTRMYLDFGLKPEQLTGLDLRPGAIVLAKALNPAIRFLSCQGTSLPFKDEKFNWVSLTTVMSSIKAREERECLAQLTCGTLGFGGYVFYYDRVCANDFAGGDRIVPEGLFGRLEKVWSIPIRWWEFMPPAVARADLVKVSCPTEGGVRSARRHPKSTASKINAALRSFAKQFARKPSPSHEALLFRKKL